MSFDTPKGKMTFRKEDHQAMQSMYHFKIKVDPAFAWGVPELVREIKPEEMNHPDPQQSADRPTAFPRRRGGRERQSMLETRDLTIRFGGHVAVDASAARSRPAR